MMGAWEDYVYPGTNVLRNKAGIKDLTELSRFERGVTAIRIQELRERPLQGDYDLNHLQAIHQHVFKDVYEWAGQLRTVDIAKGSGPDRTMFAYVEEIKDYGKKAHELVRDMNYGRGQERTEFASTLGDVYKVLNDMHPFREGNGRATREYMISLGRHAGYTLDYSRVDGPRWNEAAKESAHGNPAPMREVFRDIALPERAIAFDSMKPSLALAKYPELDGAYKTLAAANAMGQDLGKAREQVSKELNEGRIVNGGVTVDESRRVIERSAEVRALNVRDLEPSSKVRGEVVAQSAHHVMLKVGDMVAIPIEKSALSREVHVGESIAVQKSMEGKVAALGQAHQVNRGGDMQREIGGR